ncbi:glycoside hydrolase family 31 protein [Opitutus sp. ER46]|uniref:glycoside hydrolase family 31 protein n=1 Tax=Opitutus sp. ER46 TaxID=2161864 RepID=UPI000D324388|nr:glycoside hydrolase family 31 protein [Opitutus sp. ER46]PTX96621.1 alpha-glucosidase [Opitutus sp. ER46]
MMSLASRPSLRSLRLSTAALLCMLGASVCLGTPAAAASTDLAAADPAAIVATGNARFTVLTPQLIRLEWSPTRAFEDRASLAFIQRRLPVPKFTVTRDGDATVLRTDALTLRYAPAAGSDGRFAADNLTITFRVAQREATWQPGQPATGNLLGTTRTLDGARGGKTKEPIGEGVISRDGWVLVDDSTRPLFDSADFSFKAGEKSPWPWVQPRPEGDRQDWYFFGHGHDYRAALADFTRVAGKIPLPPRFAFGAWWSRYWAYSDQELLELARGFRANDVPLDVFVIDMDWHLTFPDRAGEKDASGHRLGWSGYSWNRALFPEPERFLRQLREEGLKLTLNLHPASGVQPWEDAYAEMARAMGIDPATKAYVPFDLTNPKFARNYMSLLHHPLERQGIDFWWLDWQQEHRTALAGVNPTWWLNYVHFTDQQRQGKRPLLFHRWGGLGNHRFQIGFSGDTISVWESLAYQPWFTATAANVGYAYWSHDIGGHMPGKVDPELYLRWIQFGVFSPILRTHTTKNADSERRIWAYPEPYSSLMRQAFHLRYSLIPYLYTEARRTYDEGVAFLRPLYYDWPEADEAYAAKGEYLFGHQLLVAPVTAPVDAATGLAAHTVWLPEGEWFEWPTGRQFRGPAQVARAFGISEIPVYARAGAIIPQQPPMRHTGEKPVDPLILTVFPLRDGQESTYRLYEDDGHAEDYQHGVCRWTPITAAQRGDELVVRVAAVEGQVPALPPKRAYELRLPADWPPVAVTCNGQPLAFTAAATAAGWRFEGNTLSTIVRTPPLAVTDTVEVRVARAPGQAARRARLEGFAGRMTRLRAAYDALLSDHPHLYSPDVLTAAMQTGRRLDFNPGTAEAEIAGLPAACSAAHAWIKERADQAARPDAELRAYLKIKPSVPSEEAAAQLARFRAAITLAKAQLDALRSDHP